MLPKALHIEQIENFFETLSMIGDAIKVTEDTTKKGELSLQYFKLAELWVEMDYMTTKIKDTIDTLDAEEEE